MGLIDSHAHLTDKHLIADVDGVLARARQAGVDGVISIASDVADAVRAVELARSHTGVWATAGIHPHEAANVVEDDWPKLQSLLSEGGVVAVGEIGLDFHYDFSDRASQLDVFGRQLAMAAKTSLPLVVHCRDAFDETVALLRDKGMENRPVVFHCFAGTAAEAEVIAAHGWRISFTGLVTYRSAKQVQDVARDYPADKLMIETDSPYLSPVPVRRTFPNEPAHLVHTAEFLANLRGQTIDELVEQTSDNTRAFFGLS